MPTRKKSDSSITGFGPRILLLRLKQSRSQQEIAASAGISKSMLSKVETGVAMPAVATLSRIAAALGVPVSMLFDDTAAEHTVVTHWDKLMAGSPVVNDRGHNFRLIAAGRSQKALQPILFILEKGKVKKGGLRHGGEEFVFVLEGSMRYRVGKREALLGKGDSIYFDGEEEHECAPVTASVTYLAIFTNRKSKTEKRP